MLNGVLFEEWFRSELKDVLTFRSFVAYINTFCNISVRGKERFDTVLEYARVGVHLREIC